MKLKKEELKIEKDLIEGKYKSVNDLSSRLEELRNSAKNTVNKNKNINIRLSEKDILKLKAKALQNGLPYQTLISTLLHQYVEDKIEIKL